MIRINLLPVRITQQASSRKKELILAGGMIATTLVAVLAAHMFQSAQWHEVEETANRLEGQVAVIRKQHQDIEKMIRQKKELEDKIRVVSLLTSPQRRAAAVHILDDLSASTPEFLWLTEYIETKGGVQIRGKAVDNQTIATFARNLSRSSYFRVVEIRETQQEPQVLAIRNKPSQKESSSAAAPSVMMTKFLIEAAANYGPSIETASVQPETQDPGQKEKKMPAKAASTAQTSKE
jgi:type IV pilus assembly protein PilN